MANTREADRPNIVEQQIKAEDVNGKAVQYKITYTRLKDDQSDQQSSNGIKERVPSFSNEMRRIYENHNFRNQSHIAHDFPATTNKSREPAMTRG